MPKADSLEEITERLLHQCRAYGQHIISGKDKPADELFSEERSHLLALPQVPFANEQLLSAKTDEYATVIVDKNRRCPLAWWVAPCG